jgi:hypothetical protein
MLHWRVESAQDNSEIQSQLLHRVFVNGNAPVIRQRFGDQNQAIYDYLGEDGASTDAFPDASIVSTIPNSHRFGQSIADHANPLGIVSPGLVGQGGRGLKGEVELAGQHVVLLFEDADIDQVLPTYVGLLREILTPEELLTGDCTALAAVHTTDSSDHIPRSVRHYWTEYDPDIARRDPQPKSMVQYVRAAQRISEATGESYEAVELLAKGILKLSLLMNTNADFRIRRFKHRYLIELLGGDEQLIYQYRNLVTKFVIDRYELTQVEWKNEISKFLTEMGRKVSGATSTTHEANIFLDWIEAGAKPKGKPKPINAVYDNDQEPPVTVRLGSIHSVKGETHTATMVLESYSRTHHLNALKGWLLGKKTGGSGQKAAMLRRLKLHYVAMTRPKRFLCLAMRAESWQSDEIAALKLRGWRVALVGKGGGNFSMIDSLLHRSGIVERNTANCPRYGS